MTFDTSLLPLIMGGIAAIVWLLRLEGRVNVNSSSLTEVKREIDAANVRADAEAAAHKDTTHALIRLEEQMKYMRELLERHFEPPAPKAARRRTGAD